MSGGGWLGLFSWRALGDEELMNAAREAERLAIRRAIVAEIDRMHRAADKVSGTFVARIEGALALAEAIGIVDHDEYLAFFNRVHFCPGHTPEQRSCAYCGVIPKTFRLETIDDPIVRATLESEGLTEQEYHESVSEHYRTMREAMRKGD